MVVVVDLVMAELDRSQERVADRFAHSEPHARVREYVSGLVAGLARKTGWTLAERAGDVSLYGTQRLCAGQTGMSTVCVTMSATTSLDTSATVPDPVHSHR